MKHPGEINIEDYNYNLSEEKIAIRPLPHRDESRLLVYREGQFTQSKYRDIASHIPPGSTLVFNDTEVINARITFTKSTGSKIEVFCLEPVEAESGFHHVFAASGSSVWKCFVGGAAKWKQESLTKTIKPDISKLTLTATLEEKKDGYFIIRFSWDPGDISFREVIRLAGSVPLPPYIKRPAEKIDESRYQTMFAEKAGSVAAPTAALHFTSEVMDTVKSAGINSDKITLHVGAGTFKPVNATRLMDHAMHAEWIDVSYATIKNMMSRNFIIPVGTTCLRTLESLYWIGVKVIRGDRNFNIAQWEVYEPQNLNCTISSSVAFQALGKFMEDEKMERLFTQTSILIAPGYKMRVAKALITNFHQPKSTLLLLIAAAVGNDWKKLYSYALENDFRFLSYGDGNLLFFP